MILSVPLVGNLVTMINVGRFCSTLATLLDSSVPILASMKIVKNIVANVHMARAIDEAKDAVAEGASMVGPLIKSNLFPPMVTHMIRLGEKSGELGPMLQIAAENYEDQVESRLTGLTSVLEPIMIIALGLVVGFIVFSVIVPMMKLNTLR
jgi:general secretion pathway protein F